MALSPDARDALAACQRHGRLVRYPGGQWSETCASRAPGGQLVWWFPEDSIRELVRHQLLVCTTRGPRGTPRVVEPFSLHLARITA